MPATQCLTAKNVEKNIKKLKCPAYGKYVRNAKEKIILQQYADSEKISGVNNLENDNSLNSGMDLFIEVTEQVETIGKDRLWINIVFKGLGEFPGKPYHIEIKSEIKPVINAPRRVPQSLHKELEKNPYELVQLGIVSPVNKPTEWGYSTYKNYLMIKKQNKKVASRADRVQPPLRQPYAGPHKVLCRTDKTVTIDINGRKTTVSLDRVKPAHLLPETVLSPPAVINLKGADVNTSKNDEHPTYVTR
ncbi:hypothetical protein AVEN_12777-1 [Araneus ventricosus]|uniref:Uncharacterized protein n=1 Tax=Araneus ventricosus TaxID=182803 RepID=A0A4Y2ACZ3_ARAVE|nr:hypothetical protein AVEN_12777-1 [Araneus ventricosus]